MKESVIIFLAYLLIGTITIALSFLAINIRDKIQAKKDRQAWIYQSEHRLLDIADRFETECFNATDSVFEKYVWNVRFCEWHCTLEKDCSLLLSKHKRTIDDLKKDYIENLSEKYSAGYDYPRIDGLPSYLIEKYNQRIKDIASRYRDINFTMMMRIRTLSPEYLKHETEKGED